MSELLQDIRYAIRTLFKSPGFTAVSILTLALAIGANTAIYSFMDGVLLKPLPYEDPDQIVRVLEKPPGGARNGISTLNFLDWQRDNTVFEVMAAQTGGAMALTGQSEPELLRGARVSPGYFQIFKIDAALGRTFLPDEDQPGKERVVVLSHILWRDRFGADKTILDRTIQLDNQPYTVVGVLPEDSAFDRAGAQIWRPLVFEPSNMTRNFHWFTSFARIKKGVSLEQARKEMDVIGARIEKEFPDSNKGWGVVVERYNEIIVGEQMRTTLFVLMAATGMVLLIGCANLANLALTRGVAREREVAVRSSLGASRWRLVRQFLTENVLLSLAGGALGIGLGYALMRYLKYIIPVTNFPREADIGMDSRVLLFALGISVLTGILFGLAPAIQATSPDLASSMKDGGRGASAGESRKRVRDALVIAQVSIAFILLVGSGLMIRSFFQLINVQMGFDSTNVLTAGLPTTDKIFPDPARLNAYYREIQTAVEAVPGVRETALTCALPLQGSCYGMPMQPANQPIVDRAKRQGGFFKIVTPSYFHALGMTLLKGRALSDRDAKGAPPSMVINTRLAARYFKDKNPIGERILIQEIVPGKTELGPEIGWEVVGVVADEKVSGLNDETSAGAYVSNDQSPYYGLNLVVRASLDPLTLQKSVTQAIHGVNKNQAVTDIRTLEQIKSNTLIGNRLQAGLLLTFAAIALLLAAIGIYGVMSYSVAQRSHELGIRAALGASTGSLQKLVFSRAIVLTAIGLMIGITGSLALTRLMEAILYGVGSRDPLTMALVGVILAAVAMFACYAPARRATKVDPMVALRSE